MSDQLARLTRACARRAGLVVLLGVLLAAGGAFVSVRNLGVSTDTDALFADSLPWKQQQAAFDRAFPQFQNLVVVVIDGAIPEEADATAAALYEALRQMRGPDLKQP